MEALSESLTIGPLRGAVASHDALSREFEGFEVRRAGCLQGDP